MTVQKVVEKLHREGYKRLDAAPLIWKKVRNKKVMTATIHIEGQRAKVTYTA